MTNTDCLVNDSKPMYIEMSGECQVQASPHDNMAASENEARTVLSHRGTGGR